MDTHPEFLPLPEGYLLDEYVLGRVRARERHGFAYEATRQADGAPVLIYELIPHEFATRDEFAVRARDPEDRNALRWWVRNFLDQANSLSRLQHANLVRVLKAFEANGTAYSVSEAVAGETLAEWLEQRSTLDEATLRALLMPVLSALAAAHGAGLLHRDIQPQKIVLRATDGSPVLTGFSALRAPIRFRGRLLYSAGDSAYAAPEEETPAEARGPWTDLYALGAIAWQVMTGVLPDAVVPQRPLAQVTPHRVSEALTTAVEWALQPSPAQRPQDCAAWRAVLLAEVQADEVGVAARASAREAQGKSGSGRSLPLLAVIGGGVLVFAAAAYLQWHGHRHAPGKTAAPGAVRVANTDKAEDKAPEKVTPAPAAKAADAADGEAVTLVDKPVLSGLDRLVHQQMARDLQAQEREQRQAQAQEQQQREREERERAAAAARSPKNAPTAAVATAPAPSSSTTPAPAVAAAPPPAAAGAADASDPDAARIRQLEEQVAALRAAQEAQQHNAEQTRQAKEQAKDQAEKDAAARAHAEQERNKAVIAYARKHCSVAAADLSENSNLTYDNALRVPGAVRLGNGAIRLPAVTLPSGRAATFDVTPDSCAVLER